MAEGPRPGPHRNCVPIEMEPIPLYREPAWSARLRREQRRADRRARREKRRERRESRRRQHR